MPASPAPKVPPTGFFARLRNRSPATHFLLALILLGMLAAACVPAAKPAYLFLKTERALFLTRQVPPLLDAGPEDWPEATRKVRTALQLAPRHPQVLRTAAQFCTRFNLESGLQYWEMLRATEPLTREERLACLRLALEFNHIETAQITVADLLKADPGDLEAMHLGALLLEKKQDYGKAAYLSFLALTGAPGSGRDQWTTGRLLFRHGTNEMQRGEGRRLLWNLALQPGTNQEPAVNLLTLSTNLGRAEREQLATALLSRTNVTLEDRLLAAQIRLHSAPGERAAILGETLKQVAPLTEAESWRTLGNWLLRLGAADVALAVIPPEIARTNGPLLGVRLDALARLKRWEELEQLVKDPVSPVDAVHLHALHGYACMQTGRSQLARGYFETALAKAAGQPMKLILVARSAEQARLPQIAFQAWQQVLIYPQSTMTAVREILRLGRQLDDLPGELAALTRLAEVAPNDPTAAGYFAYVEILLGREIGRHRTRLRQLAAIYPGDDRVRFPLALAELKSGDANAALSLLEASPVNWEQLDERWRVVYVAALGAGQQREAARQFARRLDRATLKTQERELILPWL